MRVHVCVGVPECAPALGVPRQDREGDLVPLPPKYSLFIPESRGSNPFPPESQHIPLEVNSILNSEMGYTADGGGNQASGGTLRCLLHGLVSADPIQRGSLTRVPWSHPDFRATAGVSLPGLELEGACPSWASGLRPTTRTG